MTFLAILGIIALVGLEVVIEGYLTMWAWNYFAAGMFGLPTITFWVAYGLCLVIQVMFKETTISTKKGE